MNREDIIQMANEALVCQQIWIDEDDSMALESVILFAKLVAAKEREACIDLIKSHGPTLANGFMLTDAIRARGEA